MFGQKKDKKIDVDLENVAIPEVHIHGDAKEGVEHKSADVQIDYSGAIPEFHIKKKD